MNRLGGRYNVNFTLLTMEDYGDCNVCIDGWAECNRH